MGQKRAPLGLNQGDMEIKKNSVTKLSNEICSLNVGDFDTNKHYYKPARSYFELFK